MRRHYGQKDSDEPTTFTSYGIGFSADGPGMISAQLDEITWTIQSIDEKPPRHHKGWSITCSHQEGITEPAWTPRLAEAKEVVAKKVKELGLERAKEGELGSGADADGNEDIEWWG
jgi:hypothetical protein